MTADSQFDTPAHHEPIVQNVANVLSGYCGRAAFDGQLQACGHDHRGEAAALVQQIRQGDLPASTDEVPLR